MENPPEARVSKTLKVMLEASYPLTGEERGEGALIFCPLTLALSRQGRENRSPCIGTSEIFCRIKVNLITSEALIVAATVQGAIYG